MKICSIDEEGRYGGPEKRIIEIANALKRYKISTHVVFPIRDSDRFSKEIKKLNILLLAQYAKLLILLQKINY